MTPSPPRSSRLALLPSLLTLLLLFWFISLRHLTTLPPVYEDEPWQVSTAWKLATNGVFGSDIFAGFYHMEQRYYGYMPIHPMFMAGVLRLTGLGLFQARFEPVVMGLLTLCLTFVLGRRLYGAKVGLGAVLFLLFVRSHGLTPSQLSGILFLDIPRIARYDMVVPVFALSAVHAYLWARRRGGWWYGLTGLLIGLAGLSHLYGVFWLAVVGIWLLWDRARWQDWVMVGMGFVLPWLPYLAYVLPHPADWVGQTQDYAPRFQLTDVNWYVQNLWRERQRYGPGLPSDWHVLTRVGFWGTAVFLPISLFSLLYRAIRQTDKTAHLLLVPALVLPLLFALFIYLKLANYLVMVWPIFALVVAWGAGWVWEHFLPQRAQRAQRKEKIFVVGRLGLVLWLVFTLVEGGMRMVALETAVSVTTPYPVFIAQVKSYIPPGSRVLGLHHYWIGLETTEYRSWFVPLLQNDPTYWHPPLPIEQSLEAINPTVILWDYRMQQWADDAPETAESIFRWMMEQGFTRAATIQDNTYGQMEIWLLEH